MPPGSAHLSFTMAGLVGAGGVAGFAKARSVPSLAAGLGCAAVFAASGVLINQGRNTQGHMLALGTSAGLAAAMGPRALKSGKFMPAGMVAALGLVSGLYHAKKTVEWWDSE